MNMVFGRFDFTPETGELRRDGRPVKLQAQPARVLAVLITRAGEIVTREALQREVWGGGTHVDFERGLNYCVAQIRSTLGDSAESPRYIETIPKQGYRFIAPLVTAAIEAPARSRVSSRAMASFVVLLVLVFGALAVTLQHGGTRQAIAVIPFYNETGRPELGLVATALSDAIVVRLATPERIQRLSVIGNAEPLRNPFARADVQGAAQKVQARWVVIGQLKADGNGQRLLAHLIRVSDMKHVWAQTYDSPRFDLNEQTGTAEAIAAAIFHAILSS